MKLIVGLGNPGKEYKLTRHNMGFMVVEQLAKLNNLKFKFRNRFKAYTAEGLIEGERIYLAMPQTFMNLSGHSVRSVANWLKIELSEMLVVIDDIAFPFGTTKIKARGSDAGHNGLRSAIDCLGTSEFSRIRIGILGRKIVRDRSQYVLSRFTKTEQKALPGIVSRATEVCECWIKQGINVAMNRFN